MKTKEVLFDAGLVAIGYVLLDMGFKEWVSIVFKIALAIGDKL